MAFGKKNVHHPNPPVPGGYLGRMEMGGCYLLEDDGIRRHLRTRFVEPGED
ncbi:MAG: hypothetical protein ACOCZ7_00110 [Armatimonadota bacterium]